MTEDRRQKMDGGCETISMDSLPGCRESELQIVGFVRVA